MSTIPNAAFTSPYYGLVHLALCELSYTDKATTTSADVPKLVQDMTTAILNLPGIPTYVEDLTKETPTVMDGYWAIGWAPTLSTPDFGNLMFAATFLDSTLTPVFTAIVVRGTDTSTNIPALTAQLVQDGDDIVTLPWGPIAGITPAAGTTPNIATGVNLGLQKLLGNSGEFSASYATTFSLDKGVVTPTDSKTGTIVDYVTDFYAQWPNTPIVVTGHSLGGCQATALALYLAQNTTLNLPFGTILPNPFAPPTAGNTDFAQLWDNTFTSPADGSTISNVWINPFDLVPMAYGDTKQIEQLWGGTQPNGQPYGGPSISDSIIGAAFVAAIVALGNEAKDTYTQLTAGATSMYGDILCPPTPGDQWVQMLMWQHFPPSYHAIISNQMASTVASYALPVDHQLPTS